jgi:hypothetical protein
MSIFGRRTEDWESFTPESRATRKQPHDFPFADLGFKILVNGLPCDRHYCAANGLPRTVV